MVRNYLHFYSVTSSRKVSRKIVRSGSTHWHQHFQVGPYSRSSPMRVEHPLRSLVAKTIRNFADKTHMSPDDLVHFQNVIQMVHDGRLEEIPMFAQEAVNQGLASLIEKLYESGFMDQ